MSLKNPVTPPGIDPGTVLLVAKRLKHYATPGPRTRKYYDKITIRLTPGDSPPLTEGMWHNVLASFVNIECYCFNRFQSVGVSRGVAKRLQEGVLVKLMALHFQCLEVLSDSVVSRN